MFLRLVKRPDVPVAALIPNLLTALALSCGLASIHFSIRAAILHAQQSAGVNMNALVDPHYYWQRALAAILFSAIFDALDGRAARMLRVTSKFGTVLDSLSDFVSFGVAPAIILHQSTLAGFINATGPQARLYQTIALIPIVSFALCSGMRLARFTAAASAPKSGPPSNYFVGMPTPAAAGAVLVPAMLASSDTLAGWGWSPLPEWLVIVYTLILAFLMISRVPMFALKRLRISRYAVAPLLVVVGVAVVMVFNDPWATISIITLCYLGSIPFAILGKRRASAAQAASVELSGTGDTEAFSGV